MTVSDILTVFADYDFQVVIQKRWKNDKQKYGVSIVRYGRRYVSKFFVGDTVVEALARAYKFAEQKQLFVNDLIPEVPTHIYDKPPEEKQQKEKENEDAELLEQDIKQKEQEEER